MAAPAAHESFEQELRNAQTGAIVQVRGVAATRAHFVEHRDSWRPELEAIAALDAAWDWLADFEAIELLSAKWETYALVSGERCHALMSVVAKADHLYVDRLAIAPSNRGDNREVKGCGAVLLVHAVHRSVALGFSGRLRLHSLEDEDTLKFYRRMGFDEVGKGAVDGFLLRMFVLTERCSSILPQSPLRGRLSVTRGRLSSRGSS